MKRLVLLSLLLASCAVPLDVSAIEISSPIVASEVSVDKSNSAELRISGTNDTTEVLYVTLQYQDGTRWLNLEEPIEVLLNDSVQVPLELQPGSYSLRTALWGFKPENDATADKVSDIKTITVIDNETQLEGLRSEWQERISSQQRATSAFTSCLKRVVSETDCIIRALQDFQDFMWESHDVKDLGGITKLTSDLQPQFSSFLYFHNIVLTKFEASFLTYCQDMKLNQVSLANCSRKLQTKDIQTARKSLRQALKVLNGLLSNTSYQPLAYGETKGLFG